MHITRLSFLEEQLKDIKSGKIDKYSIYALQFVGYRIFEKNGIIGLHFAGTTSDNVLYRFIVNINIDHPLEQSNVEANMSEYDITDEWTILDSDNTPTYHLCNDAILFNENGIEEFHYIAISSSDEKIIEISLNTVSFYMIQYVQCSFMNHRDIAGIPNWFHYPINTIRIRDYKSINQLFIPVVKFKNRKKLASTLSVAGFKTDSLEDLELIFKQYVPAKRIKKKKIRKIPTTTDLAMIDGLYETACKENKNVFVVSDYNFHIQYVEKESNDASVITSLILITESDEYNSTTAVRIPLWAYNNFMEDLKSAL